MTIAVQDWMVEDAQRLAECRHDHPFSILGPQPYAEILDPRHSNSRELAANREER